MNIEVLELEAKIPEGDSLVQAVIGCIGNTREGWNLIHCINNHPRDILTVKDVVAYVIGSVGSDRLKIDGRNAKVQIYKDLVSALLKDDHEGHLLAIAFLTEQYRQ